MIFILLDHEMAMQLNQRNLQAEPLSQLLTLRSRHKDPKEGDGGWVFIDSLISLCYDCYVLQLCRRDDTANARSHAWKNSAEDVVELNRGHITVNVSAKDEFTIYHHAITNFCALFRAGIVVTDSSLS